MSYLQDITARFPVRKRDEEKEAFRKWAVAQGKTLGYSARVEELARMLGGVKLTDITRRHARELLEKR